MRRGRARRLAVRRAAVDADGRRGGRAPVSTPIVIDCDPGHDDAIAILLALASPEVELRGIVTVAGNQTLDKTTRNALKVLELAGRTDIPVVARRRPPLTRSPAHGRARARRERPRRARRCPSRRRAPSHRRPGDVARAGRRARRRPARSRTSRSCSTRGVRDRADRLDGRRDRRGQRHAGRRVQRVRRPRGGGRRVRGAASR